MELPENSMLDSCLNRELRCQLPHGHSPNNKDFWPEIDIFGHFWPNIGIFDPFRPMPDQTNYNANKVLGGFMFYVGTKTFAFSNEK